MLKELFGDHVDGWIYNAMSVLQSAYSKIALMTFSFFGLHLSGFYGDVNLVSLLFKLMAVDLVVGTWDAYKNKKWKPRIFLIRGMIKFPMNAIYLFLIASVDYNIDRIAGVNVPLIALFCLYMLAGEVYSISRHLMYLGFKVPEPLLWLSFGFRTQAEQKMRNLINDHSNSTCNTSDASKPPQEPPAKGEGE